MDENTLKVRISYIPRVQLGETEEAGWSSQRNGCAVWKKVPFATAYELLLYQNGDRIKPLTVTSNTADLSEYMTEEADYSYQVRAMGETNAERYYLGQDGKMRTGWIQGIPGIWYYLNEDGSMARSTVIDGQYRVDENGAFSLD